MTPDPVSQLVLDYITFAVIGGFVLILALNGSGFTPYAGSGAIAAWLTYRGYRRRAAS